jgi:hypothetical protein
MKKTVKTANPVVKIRHEIIQNLLSYKMSKKINQGPYNSIEQDSSQKQFSPLRQAFQMK